MASLIEGPLSKWTNVMKGWQYRWFVLDDNSGILSYYTSRDKMVRGSRRGCVRLQGAIIGIDDDDDSTFTITVDQKIFHFQARDCEERSQWVSALEDTIMRHSRSRLNNGNKVSIEDFDNKLAEADSYLSLLIEQVKAIEVKINSIEEPEEHHESIEAVKQSIVLLQISKNTAMQVQNSSVDYVKKNVPSSQNQSYSNKEQSVNSTEARQLENQSLIPNELTVEPSQNSEKQESNIPNNPVVQPNAPVNLDEQKRTKKASQNTDPVTSQIINSETSDAAVKEISDVDSVNLVNSAISSTSPSIPAITTGAFQPSIVQTTLQNVPITSYSSSEDEDDDDDDEFYDADENVLSPKRSSQNIPSSKSEGVLLSETHVPMGQNGCVVEPEQVTHDDLYMNEDDHSDLKEGESVEEHKSVIMHLLSQVKLGMDLTKVVLPTFILERRSLLEMYADFFAHPQLYTAIADEPTPEARMIMCLRWYLSAFHAGRKGSVAKKPYNPILGEKFQCFWNLPDTEPDEYKVSDGPVSWCHRNHVTFLAEQVSHHPPVSAFYCEHFNKRMQFNGHIWTKSKFLGLSVGVHNIGQGCVRLLDLEEEYILTFPNGYGRSILTVPWVELGGNCTITCEKTGYNSNITFHTKPFYGGKVHKISAEVFAPGAKKPLFTVEGEWNGIMTAKRASGKSEVFIDTKRIPIIHKCVRKLDHQEPFESRNLWKEVTHNLKNNNIDKATKHKRALEEQQRNDAKHRAENGISYKTKYFFEDSNGNWVYKNSLINRL